ncbi:hypothetical protein KJ359_012383 [Pestalotiopsis sp. 9143b]|nr:hypothetical protein KJ359_012383 [Pestalotiopsis sp. 9143b]
MASTVLGAILSMVNFSYDAGMINQLVLSVNFFECLNVAIINVGNLIVCPFVGLMMDALGRKKTLWLSNLLALIGVTIEASAQNIAMFLVGRAILGVALGISGVCGPTLVAETMPGRLHAVVANASMLGLPLIAVTVSAAGVGVYNSESDWGWRGLVLGEAISPLLSSLFLLAAPESPRWLMYKSRPDEAKEVFERLLPKSQANKDELIKLEFEEVAQTMEFERQNNDSFRAIIAKPSDRRRFLIAALTNIFYQTSGANTLPYFFTLVLTSIGISDTRIILYLNVGLSSWSVVSLASGLWITQRFGTKTILLTNTGVMAVCLALLAVFTALGPGEGRGYGALVATFVFWWASCSCWMILEFTYPVEILRYSLRGKGTAVAQLLGYAFQLVLNYTLATALEKISWRFYVINAYDVTKLILFKAWDVVIVVCIWFIFVEIKDRTLEEVDAIFDGTVHFIVPEDVNVIEGVKQNTAANTIDKKVKDKV